MAALLWLEQKDRLREAIKFIQVIPQEILLAGLAGVVIRPKIGYL